MPAMKIIRSEFKEKFEESARIEDIILLANWFPPPFEEDTILINWISEKLKRVMTILEADDDETLVFSAFTAQTGLNKEYNELCIIAKGTNEKVKEIFNLYKLWFIENINPTEMDRIVDEIFDKYHPDFKKN